MKGTAGVAVPEHRDSYTSPNRQRGGGGVCSSSASNYDHCTPSPTQDWRPRKSDPPLFIAGQQEAWSLRAVGRRRQWRTAQRWQAATASPHHHSENGDHCSPHYAGISPFRRHHRNSGCCLSAVGGVFLGRRHHRRRASAAAVECIGCRAAERRRASPPALALGGLGVDGGVCSALVAGPIRLLCR
jgi:hypothetical protein